LSEAEILVSIEKKNSNFSAPPHLAEAENLLGLEEKTFQNFPHNQSCLRQNFWLALDNFLFSLTKFLFYFSAPT
jgi:hypothetical protein